MEIQHQTGHPDNSHGLVFNLSDHSLTTSEISIFNKGLSYVPTFATDPFQRKIELFKFFQTIKL